MVGDRVTISNRFFINHGLEVMDLGEGKVLGTNGISFALVEITYHAVLYLYQAKNLIKVMKGVQSTTIQIHPVYLEKIKAKKEKRNGEQKRQRPSTTFT